MHCWLLLQIYFVLLWLVLCSRDTFFFFNIVLDLCPKAPECVRVEESAGTHAVQLSFLLSWLAAPTEGQKYPAGSRTRLLRRGIKHIYMRSMHMFDTYTSAESLPAVTVACNTFCCLLKALGRLRRIPSAGVHRHLEPPCEWYSWGLGYFSKSWRIPAAAQKHIGIGEDDRHGVCGSVWLSRERPGSAGHQRGLGRRRSVRWSSFRFSCVRQVRWWRNRFKCSNVNT